MVLQNKYKARASRRYQAARGRGGAGGGGRGRGGPGSSRGRGGYGRDYGRDAGSGEEEEGEYEAGEEKVDGEEDEGVLEDAKEGEGEEESDRDPAFPSLKASTSTAQAADAASGSKTGVDGVGNKGREGRSLYLKRQLGSNAWRYAEPEVDPHEEVEPEPEVDLSRLLARISTLEGPSVGLGPSGSGAFSSQQDPADAEDVDKSLAYLHERNRERERARAGGAGQERGRDGPKVLSREEEEKIWAGKGGDTVDREAMRRDKEKAEAVRALKERFQGRAVGERASASSSRQAPSINIGPSRRAASPSQPSRSGSGSSSSHTTKFGLRSPPTSSSARTSGDRGTALPGNDDIDSFLQSIPSSSSSTGTGLGPTSAQEVGRTFKLSDPGVDLARRAGGGSKTENASAAGKGRGDLESFLDEMLR